MPQPPCAIRYIRSHLLLQQLLRQAIYKAMEGIHGDQLRGHLENLLLAALRKGDAHGFEILKRLEAAGSGALQLKEGSLYPALYRLEAAGLVKAAWEPGETARRGPRRRIYRLTAKGGKRLQQSRTEWELFVRVLGGILGAST
jgi:DNA-binding PadR family transcriptional regulator